MKKIVHKEGKVILLSFAKCTVKDKGQYLFRPQGGKYDMAVGEKIRIYIRYSSLRISRGMASEDKEMTILIDNGLTLITEQLSNNPK